MRLRFTLVLLVRVALILDSTLRFDLFGCLLLNGGGMTLCSLRSLFIRLDLCGLRLGFHHGLGGVVTMDIRFVHIGFVNICLLHVLGAVMHAVVIVKISRIPVTIAVVIVISVIPLAMLMIYNGGLAAREKNRAAENPGD